MKLYILLGSIATFLEFLVMFGGTTLFSVSSNLLLILIHFLNLVGLLQFKRETYSYGFIKTSFWFGALPPLILECICSMTAKNNYRRATP